MRLGSQQRRAILALKNHPQGLSRQAIQRELGIKDTGSAQRLLATLRDKGLIYTHSWSYRPIPDSNSRACRACRIYRLGNQPDAPMPPAKGKAQCKKDLIDRIGKRLYWRIDTARRNGADAFILNGKKIWQRGIGIDQQAARLSGYY